MLKIDRLNRIFSPLDSPSLTEAEMLERSDLQECIINSSHAFFAEIGERAFVVGKEVKPSDTVGDRIDILALDPEGTAIIVELKRGSNKLQMMQAISYAGMVSRWGREHFQDLLSAKEWDLLAEFLEVDVEEINRSQRILLIAEAYDYALLAGAEWLSESHGVDVRCVTLSLATDKDTSTEYLACASIFPPPALAEQATGRVRSSRPSPPLQWVDWEQALASIENAALVKFAKQELAAGRENYLRRRGFHYRVNGKRRWSFYCRNKLGYVWQRGRFDGDLDYWRSRVSDPGSVKVVKGGEAVSMALYTDADFDNFREAAKEQSDSPSVLFVDQLYDGSEDEREG